MNNNDREKVVEQVDKVREVLGDILVNQSNPEAWPTFTGTPSETMRSLLEWAVVKDVDPYALMLTVAAIAFAHGKLQGRNETIKEVDNFDSYIADQVTQIFNKKVGSQTTDNVKSASDSAS